jgi:peptide/nickel transport system permease protein
MTVATGPQQAAVSPGTSFDRFLALATRSRIATVGSVVLIALALLSGLLPALSPYDPFVPAPLEIFQAPSARHWFGTDINGMDVFTRVLYGARYSFAIAVPTVVIAILLGVPAGLYAGYRGGWADELLTRFTDTLRIFPGIILALAIVAALGPSLLNVILTLAVLDAAIFARLVRAETIALRRSGIVESAIAAGNPHWRVMWCHVFPNVQQGMIAQISVRAAWAVRVSATLAFLGIGVQPPTPEWGLMIRQGGEYMLSGQWWVGLFPGLALLLMVLGLNFLGDGLQDILDPRRRAHAD